MNKYQLTEEIKDEYIPELKKWIKGINDTTRTEVVGEFDLTNSEINTYVACLLLEELGYKRDKTDVSLNMSYHICWYHYVKDGWPSLFVCVEADDLSLTIQADGDEIS